MITTILLATIAYAGLEGPNLQYQAIEQENLTMPSAVFSAEEGEEMARSARIESGRRSRREAKAAMEHCFSEMRDAAKSGNCSTSFFAEDATCNAEEATGCFENRIFRRKLSRLGFKIRTKEMPTYDQEDHCAALTVTWCRDLRRRR